MIALALSLFFAIPSRAETYAELRAFLEKTQLEPGKPFPDACPEGFDKEAIPFEDEFPKFSSLRACRSKPGTPPRVFSVLRSGTLIAQVELNGVPPPAPFACNAKGLAAHVGVDEAKLSQKREGDASGGQASITFEPSPELVTTVACKKGNLIVKLLTPYSDVGTVGDPLRGNVVELAKTTSYTAPPYFAAKGGTVAEHLKGVNEKIAELTPRAAKLGPLAKRLWDDNVAWMRDPVLAAERLKLVAELNKKIEERKRPRFLQEDAERESAFFMVSGCYGRCLARVSPVPHPRCEEARKLLFDVMREAAALEKSGGKPGPQLEAKVRESQDGAAAKACTAGAQASAKAISLGCQKVCPSAWREAAPKEVEKLARYLASGEKNAFGQVQTYNTDVAHVMVGLGNLGSYAYKFGFLKPSKDAPTTKFDKMDPSRMNSDWILAQGQHVLPFESPSLAIRMSDLTVVCPDCTADAKGYKAIFVAVVGGKLDVWTAGPDGVPTHVSDGLPPDKPGLSLAEAFAGAKDLNVSEFIPDFGPDGRRCRDSTGKPGLNKPAPGELATRKEFRCFDLRGVSLHGLDLTERNFEASDLTGADLSGADLDRAMMSEAILEKANLRGAKMKKGYLGTKLQGAVADETTALSLPRDQLEKLGVVFQPAEGPAAKPSN